MIDHPIWIVDFGSQYTQLITRKTRELGYSSIILTVHQALSYFEKGQQPDALILSGGPSSIFKDDTDFSLFFKNYDLPVLGICYGMQIITHHFGGEVQKGLKGEYGKSQLTSCSNKLSSKLKNIRAWMSHFDEVIRLPQDFELLYVSDNNIIAGFEHAQRPIIGLQFHPEVHHTENGLEILNYFFTKVANLKKDWNGQSILESCLEQIQDVKDHHVLCAFSGGVDSLVAAILCQKVLKDKLYCFFVDNGLLRPQDYQHIEILKKETSLQIEIIEARDVFLNKLAKLVDPEEKRKMIGKTFIEIFEQKVREYESVHQIHFDFLLQGTLYPDVIESLSPHTQGGKSVTIKSHHNVGGLPEKMNLKLLEPLKFLFKDEVRLLGEQLGLKKEWVYRHPFPGPGIGVRVLGALTLENISKVQQSDQILFEELKKQNQYQECWQAFTVLLPVKTVGIKGDARAYEEVICVRVVNSVDGMTADWTDLPADFLRAVSNRITNEVAGITRVVYDITSKPPGTIEWL